MSENRTGPRTTSPGDEGDERHERHDGLDDRDELDAIVASVLVASRALVGVSARSLADVEDTVTLTQFRALVVLRTHGVTRLGPLSERLGVQASSAMRTVDRLLAGDLVTRDADDSDRRAVVIGLTAKGRRLVDTVTERRRVAIAEIVEQMPATRRRGLVRALTAFAEAAGEPVPAPAEATTESW